mmetsp:Transcript_31814/g.58560  ORF Transcript_31814/g.58560 Transcript_31814/m.58560 type:complete len:91 (+) Transcript_31814:314-586(+)
MEAETGSVPVTIGPGAGAVNSRFAALAGKGVLTIEWPGVPVGLIGVLAGATSFGDGCGCGVWVVLDASSAATLETFVTTMFCFQILKFLA